MTNRKSGNSGEKRENPGGDFPKDDNPKLAEPVTGDSAMKKRLPHEGKTKKVRPPTRREYCHGKAKGTGKRCRRWALVGRDFCRLHGGKARRGMVHPAWKTGFYSQALPMDVAKLARRAAADPELKDMRSLIAIADVRIREVCGTLGKGMIAWDVVDRAVTELETACREGLLNVTAAAKLRDVIKQGQSREWAWGELRELIQERDKLLTGEANRHKITADMINADRVAAFMVGMIDALREESQDRDLLRRVLGRWERLMGLAGVTTPARAEG